MPRQPRGDRLTVSRNDIRPKIIPATESFWAGCRTGELRVQRCGSCGRLRYPAQPMCPRCRSTDRSWVAVSGRGTVYTFSVVTGHGPEALLPGTREVPYGVAVIELEEGPRMVTDIDADALTLLRIGAPARVVFERIDDEISLPRFEISSG
jgi:uncharacterized protein